MEIENTFASMNNHITSGKDVKTILSLLKTFEPIIYTVTARNIKLQGNKLLFGDGLTVTEESMYTPEFLDSLCKILGIPLSYAYKIPHELLEENISKLLNEREDFRFVLYQSGSKLINITRMTKSMRVPFSDIDFLTQCLTLEGTSFEPLALHDIQVSDYGTSVYFRSEHQVHLHPTLTPFYVGIALHNSPYGFYPAIGELYLSNHSDIHSLLSRVCIAKRPFNDKVEITAQLESMVSLMGSYDLKLHSWLPEVSSLYKYSLTPEQFKKYWQLYKKTYCITPDKADKLFKVTETTRKSIFEYVSKKRKNPESQIEAYIPSITWDEVLAGFTEIPAIPSSVSFVEKLRLNRLAGKVLSDYLKERAKESINKESQA